MRPSCLPAPRLHWTRGRVENGPGDGPGSLPAGGPGDGGPGDRRTLEWIGRNDAGEAIARIVRIQGPLSTRWRLYWAVALDEHARIVQLRPSPPEGAGWLACVGGQVVGRAALPLQAVRTAEAALG